jgi:hypothetical protein
MMRGITVCVDYDDLLAITLPRNARHFSRVYVITTPDDARTLEVIKSVPNAIPVLTDAFYRHGAKFNKGLAMELGLDHMGRTGWICIFDADTIMPDDLKLPKLEVGCLYGMRRRILHDVKKWHPGMNWNQCPVSADRVIAGYFQLFSAEDTRLRDTRPWYDVTFTHAGGCDGYFQSRYKYDKKVWLDAQCLHLGPRDANWFGRATDRLDGEQPAVSGVEMQAYAAKKGWKGGCRDDNLNEHVEVPGFHSTGYLP